MIRIPCSKCFSVDIPKFTCVKNRGNGVTVPYMATFCIACYKEDRKIYRAKNHEKIKARMTVYIKKWDKDNRQKRREIVNKSQRKKALLKSNVVDWYCTSVGGYTHLTYSEAPVY